MVTYLDNAATTYPKPEAVTNELTRALSEAGATPHRGTHKMARSAGAIVEEARMSVAALINAPDAKRVAFTPGATAALNLVLKGTLTAGQTVVTTALEHNAVLRPLASLGVQVKSIAPGENGVVSASAIEEALDPNTRLIVMTHASNVTGVVQPVEAVARIAAARKVPLLLDCAQTAGCWPIDVSLPGISAVVFSGHKGLFGTTGTGVLWLAPGFEPKPLVEGGTGYDAEEPPVPDRYEAGTPNTAGIAALAAGVRFVRERGVENIAKHSRALIDLFVREGGPVDGVRVLVPETEQRVGVVSFTMEGYTPAELAAALDSSFDIAVRAGLHCAPAIHAVLGTAAGGTVRVSTSALTTEGEMNYMIEALHQMAMLA